MDASEYSYELLVIDDKSTDNTLEVLKAALPKFPKMRLMPFRTNGGSGTARRIGTREAFGRIVVWTDADMTYPNERIPEFVERAADKRRRPVSQLSTSASLRAPHSAQEPS